MRVSYYDGTDEQALHLSYWDGTTEYVLSSVEPMPYGYLTVQDMLNQDQIFIGYHGGSADFPEASLYGYTQSIAWGIPAMEIPLARSADGVLFGLNDQYLDRTSLGAAGSVLDPTLMTWDDIQDYQINQFGQAKPYCKLADLLDAYFRSHVVCIDPGQVNISSLWQLLASYPDYEDKIIIVSRQGTDTTLADQAHSHGCMALGLYQASDDLDTILATAAQWNLLGMEVGSDGSVDSAAWSAVLDLGKTVIGHTCSTTVMVDGAFSAGAKGVLVSGIKELYASSGPKVLTPLTTVGSALPFALPTRLGAAEEPGLSSTVFPFTLPSRLNP